MLSIMNCLYAAICMRFDEFKREERGAVDIVAIVVMIGIAVLLAALFKDQISGLLTSLLNTIKGKATETVTG